MDRGDQVAPAAGSNPELLGHSNRLALIRVGLGHLESEQALCLLDATLQVADGVHLAIDPDGHQGLGDFGDRPVRITLAPIRP